MKGYPKFKVGDNVSFTINNVTRNGIVLIVDAYGAFCLDDASYDILVETENCLYKHVEERMLLTISVAESELTVHHKEQKSGLRNGLTTQNAAELSNSLAKLSETIDSDAILLIKNMLCNHYSSTELLEVLNSARTQQEVSKRSARSFVSTTLKMMIDAGLLAPLYPKTPHHPKQKYYLTELGKTMLAYLRNTDCME